MGVFFTGVVDETDSDQWPPTAHVLVAGGIVPTGDPQLGGAGGGVQQYTATATVDILREDGFDAVTGQVCMHGASAILVSWLVSLLPLTCVECFTSRRVSARKRGPLAALQPKGTCRFEPSFYTAFLASFLASLPALVVTASGRASGRGWQGREGKGRRGVVSGSSECVNYGGGAVRTLSAVKV